MAVKVDRLRRELASRDLPREGLKKDVTLRPASSDHVYALRPLRLPHPTSALTSVTSTEEVMLGKIWGYNVPAVDVRSSGPKRSSPSCINSSSPSIHDQPRRKGAAD